MEFYYELEAITRWVMGAAGLNSMLLTSAPPKVARPVILWEAPQRSRDRNVDRYQYVNRVRQYGKIYAADLRQLLDYQGRLQIDLEDRENLLDVYDGSGAKVGRLKAVTVSFGQAEGLDVPIIVDYEATYARTRPAAPPAPKIVVTTYKPPEGR